MVVGTAGSPSYTPGNTKELGRDPQSLEPWQIPKNQSPDNKRP